MHVARAGRDVRRRRRVARKRLLFGKFGAKSIEEVADQAGLLLRGEKSQIEHAFPVPLEFPAE